MQTRIVKPGREIRLLALLLSCTLLAACNASSQPEATDAHAPATEESPAAAPSSEATPPEKPPISSPPVSYPSSTPREAGGVNQPRPPVAAPSASEAEGLFDETPSAEQPPKPSFEPAKIRTAGIRRLESKHLILYTDLPSATAIDQLPQVFDLAIPQWCDYFEIDRAEVADWQMIGCLIEEKNRFAGAGLFPSDLPDFPHGYHRDWQFWVYQQPSEYYNRHLVLHEGTHAFMRAFLGNAGPPWYMEGMAEYLGTHRWAEETLTLGYMPGDKEEVPYWGRVKIIADDYAANRGQTLDSVLAFGPQAHLRTEAYAWSWAAVTLLSEHPLSKQPMREMLSQVNLPAGPFARKLQTKLGDDWPKLAEQWQLMVSNMEYGYDVPRNAVEYEETPQQLPAEGVEVEISAEHGWQSTGYRLQQGTKYEVKATGQYTIAAEPQPWACEPGGVTLEYYRGQPLGKLLGALRAGELAEGTVSPLVTPGVIGLEQEVTPEFEGVLYLCINEHPGRWADNRGTFTVSIKVAQ